jgi:uncharacterized protein (DUF3820 family)
MVYDGRSVSDGCQMHGVRWLYREGLSDGEDGYDGRSVSDGCQMVYDGVGWLYREGFSDGEDGV